MTKEAKPKCPDPEAHEKGDLLLPCDHFPKRGVHDWFELTYAQYLTVPRSALQSMPEGWQERLVALLDELDAKIDWRPKKGRYWVSLKDAKGRFVSIAKDPLMDYERGRRRVDHKAREKGL